MLLTIHDETASGSVTNKLTLDVLTERIAVRELIRSRIYQEVHDHNRAVREAKMTAPQYNGLVTPSPIEQQLNGPAVGRRPGLREIDWKQQFETACDAFTRNGFFILVDDRQVEELDDEVTLRSDTVVSFVKLTPLVGG